LPAALAGRYSLWQFNGQALMLVVRLLGFCSYWLGLSGGISNWAE
jgi:hypothetical protein